MFTYLAFCVFATVLNSIKIATASPMDRVNHQLTQSTKRHQGQATSSQGVLRSFNIDNQAIPANFNLNKYPTIWDMVAQNGQFLSTSGQDSLGGHNLHIDNEQVRSWSDNLLRSHPGVGLATESQDHQSKDKSIPPLESGLLQDAIQGVPLYQMVPTTFNTVHDYQAQPTFDEIVHFGEAGSSSHYQGGPSSVDTTSRYILGHSKPSSEELEFRSSRLKEYPWQLAMKESDLLKLYETIARGWGLWPRSTNIAAAGRLGFELQKNPFLIDGIMNHDQNVINEVLRLTRPKWAIQISRNDSSNPRKIQSLEAFLNWLTNWIKSDFIPNRSLDAFRSRRAEWAPTYMTFKDQDRLLSTLENHWGMDKTRVRNKLYRKDPALIHQYGQQVLDGDRMASAIILAGHESNRKQKRTRSEVQSDQRLRSGNDLHRQDLHPLQPGPLNQAISESQSGEE